MEDEELSSHLKRNGLDNVIFWKQQLEEKLGVKSKASLDLLTGDMASYSELEKEAKFPVERKALQKIFKVDKAGQKEEKAKKTKKKAEKKEKAREKSAAKKEELRKQEERAQAILKELEQARLEGKGRHDERIHKLEGEIREVLNITPESWISKDKSLDELIKKLEARHEVSAQVQARQPLEDGMLLQNGRALHGVLLTKKLEDQLEKRSRLLEIPEKVVITGAAQAEDKILQFSSSHQENLYKKTVDVLGHGITVSSSGSYGGFSAHVGVSKSDRSEQVKTHQENTKEMYSSTVKYSTLQVASYSFENKDLKLSSDAKEDLKQVLKKFKIEGESSASVQEACKRFFLEYGSHVNKGPFRFGGSFWWTCFSRGFSHEDTETVKNMQSEAISATAGVSFAGFGVSTEVSMDKVKASYEGKCTKDTLASTSLQVKIAGGPPEVTDLSLWKNGLVANNSTWIVTDRGKKVVAVWDIIRKNHEREFGKIRGVLQSTWEKMSGLEAEQELSSVLEYDPDSVLEEVNEWNENEDLTPRQIKDNLEHLSRVKEDIISKTGNPKIWITEYLSASPVQDFFESVVDSELGPHFERAKSLMEKLAPLDELSQLDSRIFPSIEEVSDWLYKPGELTTYCNMQRDIVDFESFDNFLQKTIENASIAQLKADGASLELSAKSREILARDVSKGILFLRSYFLQSYDDILITILVNQYHSSRYGDVVTLQPKAITFNHLKFLRQLFSKEKRKFDRYFKKKHPIHVQAYLFNLAVELSSDAEKGQLQQLLQHIADTMKDFQLPLEKELSEVLNEYRGTSLLAPFQHRLQSLMDTPYRVKPSQPTPMTTSKSHSLKNALLTATHQARAQTDHQSSLLGQNSKAEKLFEELGLSKLYPKKMQLKDALCIRPETLKLSLNEANPTDPKQLPYLVLHKLMSYDYLCRSDLLKPKKGDQEGQNGSRSNDSESDDYEDSDDDNDNNTISTGKHPAGNSSAGIHPVDSLLALILCSDDFLSQDLLSRLAKCQLAVPFILPDPFTKQLSIPLWAMQSIVKEWKCLEQTGTGSKVVQRTHPIVDYGMPIVSFIRFGKPQKRGQSKSKILNEVISESHYDHFFHRDSPGGQYDLLLGDGLVDMCWYLPAGIPADAFPDSVTFLNLHGDARQHLQQSKFLSQISSMCFVLINEEDMKYDEQTMDILKKFSAAPGGITILNDVQQKPKTLKKEIPKAHVVNLTNKNAAEIKESIRNRIKSKLADKVNDFQSIEVCCTVRDENIVVDEDNAFYKEGLSLAIELKDLIMSHRVERPCIKEVMLPLQGKSLWQAWATADKELHRQVHRGDKSSNDYTSEINDEKRKIREQQLEHLESLSPVMESFMVSLLKLRGPSNRILRNYFLQCLKLELNGLSRESITGMQLQYQATRKDLAKLLVKTDPKEGGEAKPKGEDSPAIKMLKKKMKELQENIINASFGLEHLFREFGQIYEAAFASSAHVGDLSLLPKAAAELLLEGYPLEVMDGDAAHVPRQWITAVFEEAVKLLKDPRVFVLSVLGLQSTGKSTMLNTAFGLQFNVSAGRCTRGAFIQLLPLDEKLQAQTHCDYVLIVDTEGLRAPELDPLKTQKHDNELATFVIGLANMTLINIYGEVPGDMDDILQTSVHAFLRMNKVKYSPSCQFVHQNAGANLNSEVGRAKFTQKLNKFTVDAAREENCEGQFEVFNDVIQFDDQKDVHHFPGLWKGDPPMAPVNQGYSHSAQMLKYQFIDILEERGRKCDLSLSSFHVKVGDLWNTLLKENFVFSFKNTLEITAYNSLEMAYSTWDQKFQESLLEWERRAENSIKAEKPEAIPELLNEKRRELIAYVSKEYGIYKSEMDAFFKGKQSEILVQWKAKFEKRLSTLKKELQDHAEKHCVKLGQSREGISKIEKEQKEFAKMITKKVQDTIESLKLEQEKLDEDLERRKLDSAQLKKLLKRRIFTREALKEYEKQKIITESQKKSILLVVERCEGQLSESQLSDIMVGGLLATEQAKMVLKKAKQTRAELEVEFNMHWQELVDSLPLMSGEDVAIDHEVERRLFDYVGKQGYDGQLIGHMQEKGQNQALRKWGIHLEFLPEEGEHYHKIETSSWVGRQVENFSRLINFFKSKKTKPKPDPHQVEALNMTDRILNEARIYLKKLEKVDTDFNTAYIQELLRILDKKITVECQALKDHLIITPEYRLEVYLTACGYAVPKFEVMRDSFKERNDPRLYLEKNIKGPLFAKFENQYYQTAAEEAIANTLCSHLEEPIKKQIAKKIGVDMRKTMRESGKRHFSSKMALKVKVLIDMHDKKDEFEQVMYYVTNIKACLERWLKYYSIQYWDEIESGDSSRLQNTAKQVVGTMIRVVKDQVKKMNETDAKKWLSAFCKDKKIKEELGIDLEPVDIYSGESLQELNLNNFKQQIEDGLQKLQEKLKASLDHIKYETEMVRWQDKPHELLSKDLVGCTAGCPFCGEQCDRQLSDHKGEKHKVDVHRSTCLIGYHYEGGKDDGKLVTHFCPTEVSDKEALFKDKETNFQPHHFSDYASIPAYSNWSILPDAPCEDSKYWKRFICIYNSDLATRFRVKRADIPSDWPRITWPEVESNLKTVYHL